MKTKIYSLGILIAAMVIVAPCTAQETSDIDLAKQASRSLGKAAVLNGITIGLGAASNIEMAIIGGFPLSYQDGGNPGVNISHMFLSVSRFTFSIFPPIQVAKARNTLKPWRESPEMAASCTKLFSCLDAAQVLTAAAPVLCIAGGIMMASGSVTVYSDTYPGDQRTLKNPGLMTAGWVIVGAGLAASISAACLISISKKELQGKMGSLGMNVTPTGIGLTYSLPVTVKIRRVTCPD